jgi:hypothetical protein
MSKQELATVAYTELKNQVLKLSKNRKVTSVYNQDNKLIRFKTDTISLPFGANVNKFKTFGPTEYYLECNISENLRVELDNLSSRIQALIHENQGMFDLENHTLDDIKRRWTDPVKSDSYGSKIRVKITRSKSTDDLDFNVFDENLGTTSKEQYVFVDDRNLKQVFKPKSRVMMAIKLGNVYYFKERFGMTFSASQIKFQKKVPEDEAPSSPSSIDSESGGGGGADCVMLDDF